MLIGHVPSVVTLVISLVALFMFWAHDAVYRSDLEANNLACIDGPCKSFIRQTYSYTVDYNTTEEIVWGPDLGMYLSFLLCNRRLVAFVLPACCLVASVVLQITLITQL
jgi:hypothetical protein